MMTLEQIVDKIVAESGRTRDEVMAMIKEVRDDAGGMVSQIGAASIAAYRLGVKLDFDQFETGLPARPCGDPVGESPPMLDTGTDPADSTCTGTALAKAACVPPPPQNHTRIAETIYNVLTALADQCGDRIPISRAEKCVVAYGILEHTFDAFIEGEIQRGKIYRPSPETIALVNYRSSRSTKT